MSLEQFEQQGPISHEHVRKVLVALRRINGISALELEERMNVASSSFIIPYKEFEAGKFPLSNYGIDSTDEISAQTLLNSVSHALGLPRDSKDMQLLSDVLAYASISAFVPLAGKIIPVEDFKRRLHEVRKRAYAAYHEDNVL